MWPLKHLQPHLNLTVKCDLYTGCGVNGTKVENKPKWFVLPFKNCAPCGKLSSWLCSASQEYRAFASLRDKKYKISKNSDFATHNQFFFLLHTFLKNICLMLRRKLNSHGVVVWQIICNTQTVQSSDYCESIWKPDLKQNSFLLKKYRLFSCQSETSNHSWDRTNDVTVKNIFKINILVFSQLPSCLLQSTVTDTHADPGFW